MATRSNTLDKVNRTRNRKEEMVLRNRRSGIDNRWRKLCGFLLLIFFIQVTGSVSVSPVWAETIDLMDTRVGRVLHKFIEKVGRNAPGNRSSTRTALSLDTNTGEVNGRVEITLGNYWGRIRAPTYENPNRKVDVALDASLAGEFGYNLMTQMYHGKLEFKFPTLDSILGTKHLGTISIPLDRIIDIIEGNIDINELLEMIPNPIPQVFRIELRNEYDKIKKSYEERHTARNIYFAKKRFVEWANPCEKVFTWGAELVVTGGAAAELIMHEVKAKLLDEKDEILVWLRAHSEAQAVGLFDMLLSGKRFTWPYLSAVWQPVRYEARRYLFNRLVHDWLPCNHIGFVLIWEWADNPRWAKEKYTDLTNEIFEQLYDRIPKTKELKAVLKGFAKKGEKYAETIFTDVTEAIYAEVYGPGELPTSAALKLALDLFDQGWSYAEVKAEVMAQKAGDKPARAAARERAVVLLLTQYLQSRSGSTPSEDPEAPVEPSPSGYDLAITKILAPKTVTLTRKKPARAKVQVTIQNRGDQVAIRTLPELENLVVLEVESLKKKCSDPIPKLDTRQLTKRLPLELKPKKTLTLPFEVSFTCANDPAKGVDHTDYGYSARVDLFVLNGELDDLPANDECPALDMLDYGCVIKAGSGKFTDVVKR